ncbi:hypothetical protein SPBR_03776 [Sporothrix brasiliensis 5110]|uniref:DNA-directed RNA polymerase III subunit RPC9 n=1 Tax=Sporothrix brasiliensis 5110 TaxID=1398154 RepID=A0A0C2FUL2_9PEZI|nr:uncharacterized protein SPBR_03776 [Sporothrix brasiliensis 5110]KIH94683.1 hypothetical protein SPBR_03776 [Sporothrix brasiliensis 5110]
MKILEAQNALLSNYEVYQFLAERQERLGKQKQNRRRGPGNLETLIHEYFRSPPGPLSQQPVTYSPEAVTKVVERLHSYDLAKGELLMVLNMRPQTPAQLHACIEEVEGRLTEEQQSEILDIVAQVLGQFPVAEGEPDEEMEDAHPSANVVDDLRHQLARNGRTLEIHVGAQLLAQIVRLVRVQGTAGVVLAAQIALEAEHEDGQTVAVGEDGPDLADPVRLQAGQAGPVADVEAEDDEVGLQTAPVLGAFGVGEFEAEGGGARAELEDKRLVGIAQERRCCCLCGRSQASFVPKQRETPVGTVSAAQQHTRTPGWLDTHDKKVDLPTLSSPSNKIETG